MNDKEFDEHLKKIWRYHKMKSQLELLKDIFGEKK